MTIQAIPFSQLMASDAVNARAASKEGLDELAASIAAKGLIQALAVRAHGNYFEVIDGRRRLQALTILVKAKKLKRDWPVPCTIRDEDDAAALETSLMANTVRLPMHPVDQHEVFARLSAQGRSEAEIAASFGLAERTVRQHLALGRLAEPVRKAWRKGTIDARCAQAFALAPKPEVQAALLERLGQRAEEWNVRSALAGTRERLDQSDELALIGEAAYLAAGGTITEDLFDDAVYVDDVPLARKLARDRLEAECAKLRKAGWSWAGIDDDDDAPDQWDCTHVREDGDEELPTENYTADERARAGCLVSIGYSGKGVAGIDIATGLIKPAHHGARQTDLEDAIGDEDDDSGEPGELPSARAMVGEDPEDAAGADPFRVSQALEVTLHEAMTVAAAQVLKADPLAALQVLVAQLETSSSNGPVKVTDTGNAVVSDRHARDHQKRFSHRLKHVRDADTAALLITLAGRVAQALSMVPSDVGVYNATTERGEVEALRDYLYGEAYLGAMRQAFTPDDYFKRATKATTIAALEEMHDGGCHFGLQGRADLEGMKKLELATWAAEQAARWGWLPPQLRHPAYALLKPEPKPLRGKMAAAEQTSEASGSTARMRSGHPKGQAKGARA